MTLPDPDDTLAAEYALGVLDAPDRAAAEARIARDPAFAEAVARWHDRLAPLNAAYPEVAPPAPLRARIEARLFPAPPRRRLGWWGAVAGAAVAALLLVGVLALQGPAPVTPRLQAALQDDTAPVAFAATWDGAALRITRTAGAPAPAGRDYQLWLIGPSGVPESLGLLATAETRLPRPDLAPGLVLAVSLEPAGGAPGPAPTGPVLLTAALSPP
jgi:anti-sigma-K factor RskA